MTQPFEGVTAALLAWSAAAEGARADVPQLVQNVIQDRAGLAVWSRCKADALQDVIQSTSVKLFRAVCRGADAFASPDAEHCDARNVALVYTAARNTFLDEVRRRQRTARDCGYQEPVRISDEQTVQEAMALAERLCRAEGKTDLQAALPRRLAIANGASPGAQWRNAWPGLSPAEQRRLGEQEERLVLKWLGRERGHLAPDQHQLLYQLRLHVRTRPDRSPKVSKPHWQPDDFARMAATLKRHSIPQSIDRIGAQGRATVSVEESLDEMVKLACGTIQFGELQSERAAKGATCERDALYKQHSRARGQLLERAQKLGWDKDDLDELTEFLQQLKRRR